MNNKELYKKTLALAAPMMIQNGITNAVGLVDNIMVGSIGTEAMTAVSIAGQLLFVFSLAIFGGLAGPGIYGAQFYGQNNTEGLKNTFRMKWLICGFCLAIAIPLFIFKGDHLLKLYLKGDSNGIDPELIISHGLDYLHIMLWGLIPFVITQVYSGSLRETGNSVTPMIAGICSVCADILFNYMLIYGNFGMPRLGVKGAAIATNIARVIEMSIIVISAHAGKNKPAFLVGVYKSFKIPKSLAGDIVRKGLPIFLNEFLWSAGIAALTQCYSLRGMDIIPGLNISNALCNLLNVVFIALGNAIGIVIGQLLGAGEFDRARKSSFGLAALSGSICVGLTVILAALSGVFPRLYNVSEEVRHLGSSFIIITALFFPVQGVLNSLYFTLRSGGKTFVTFLFDSVFSWVVSIPLALALCKLTDLSILPLYAAVQATDILKCVIGAVLIKKGVWITSVVGTEKAAE